MRAWIALSLAGLVAAELHPGAQTARPAPPATPAPAAAPSIPGWTFDGNGTWAMHGPILVLEKAGVPGGPIRRPAAIALLDSPAATNFTMTADVRSTAPVDLLVRDVLLILDYQSPSRFYYVHIAGKADGVHSGIFLVNDADRKRIDTPGSTPHMTDQAWHHVRLERDATGAGTIRVFFDDLAEPILQATDTTLTSGRVGVGSFDETGEFRQVQVTRK
jgi:hypothetical protein